MSLTLLGILNAQAAGGGGAEAFDLLESETLSSSAAVSFTGLDTYASTYKHLQLRMIVRTARSANNDQLIIRFNGDTGTNYTYHEVYGNGTSVVAYAAGASQNEIRVRSVETEQNANGFTAIVFDLLDAYSTDKYTTARWLTGAAGINNVALSSGLWLNTAALTSMSITGISNLAADSRLSLYGVK